MRLCRPPCGEAEPAEPYRTGRRLSTTNTFGSLMNFSIEELKFDERGLIPAIVQEATTHEVLTLAYMNAESLRRTIAERQTWFWSRSRRELWHKGETSGHTQHVIDIILDCDQ